MTLRLRFTLWQIGLLAVALVAFAFLSYRFLATELAMETDKTLRERADHVAEALRAVPNRSVEEVYSSPDEFDTPGIYVQVLTPTGEVVARSYNLGQQRLPVNPSLFKEVLIGKAFLTTETVERQQIRLYHRPITREDQVVGVVQVGQSQQGLHSTLGWLRTIYLVGIGVALLVGGLVVWVVVWLALRPVTETAGAVLRIAQTGDLNERLIGANNRHDELGKLQTAFNLMMDRLESAFDAQRQLIADTAHELRTPLATIVGNIDLLQQYGDDPRRRTATMTAIRNEGERTSRLVTDLLFLALADSGLKLELSPIDLDEVFIEVYEQIQASANGRHIVLAECQPAPIMGDRDRMKQVMLNLIDNALKHTPQTGRVTLSLVCEQDHVQFVVADTGAGVPASDLPHLFERLYQGKAPGAARKPGTGLGLAIAKWIVEQHRGTISAQSELGKGSLFAVRVPIRR